MNKGKLLLIIILFSGYIQAQEGVSSDEPVSESSIAPVAVELELNSSPVILGNTDKNIIALAPFTEAAPGVCLVIANILSVFCDSNPQDMSCQFQ